MRRQRKHGTGDAARAASAAATRAGIAAAVGSATIAPAARATIAKSRARAATAGNGVGETARARSVRDRGSAGPIARGESASGRFPMGGRRGTAWRSWSAIGAGSSCARIPTPGRASAVAATPASAKPATCCSSDSGGADSRPPRNPSGARATWRRSPRASPKPSISASTSRRGRGGSRRDASHDPRERAPAPRRSAGTPVRDDDPADARDHDDAVFAAPRGRGHRLLVAIADVGSYVAPGSALDREARNRANSVYLPGRVVPMLPERLSADLCSLRPDVERLAFVADLRVDAAGRVTRRAFYPACIRSAARLSYEEAQAWFERPQQRRPPAWGAGLSALLEVTRRLGSAASERARSIWTCRRRASGTGTMGVLPSSWCRRAAKPIVRSRRRCSRPTARSRRPSNAPQSLRCIASTRHREARISTRWPTCSHRSAFGEPSAARSARRICRTWRSRCAVAPRPGRSTRASCEASNRPATRRTRWGTTRSPSITTRTSRRRSGATRTSSSIAP